MSVTSPQASSIDQVATIGAAADRLQDDYLRWEHLPDEPCRGWVLGQSAVLLSQPPDRRRWLTAVGDPEDLLLLLAHACETLPSDLYGLTVPLALKDRLPAGLSINPTRVGEWEWMRTYQAPPEQPQEHLVELLSGADDEIADLLAVASPRHSAAPGSDDIVRWCGVRDKAAGGRLIACAAHTEHVPGVPHLASIATHPAARGGGLGAAVTAWLTRACLAEGAPVVTLGMYADNDVARRVYHRLGFANDHAFYSARLS